METILQKACGCRGSSSGPRVVTQAVRSPRAPGVWFFLKATLVSMACDVCDEPWQSQAEGDANDLDFVEATC